MKKREPNTTKHTEDSLTVKIRLQYFLEHNRTFTKKQAVDFCNASNKVFKRGLDK